MIFPNGILIESDKKEYEDMLAFSDEDGTQVSYHLDIDF